MKSDLIDIQVESRGNDVELTLSGSLGVAQLSAVKEKLDMLVDGPGCFFFLNLQNAHFTSDHYLNVFLELLNRVKDQKSALILIFDSAELYDYFSRYLNIFEVYENRNAYKKSGTKKQLQQIGIHYGLRSGITISSGVAVAFLSLIVGWIVTLLIIISTQGHDLSDKQAQIIALHQGNRQAGILYRASPQAGCRTGHDHAQLLRTHPGLGRLPGIPREHPT